MKKAQVNFGEEIVFRTFGHKQSAIFSTRDTYGIKECLMLYEQNDDSYYYKQKDYSIRKFIISGKVTMLPNGRIQTHSNPFDATIRP